MATFKDYGTNEEDDIMVRELPNLENHVRSLETAVKQAREKMAPGNQIRRRTEREFETAKASLAATIEAIKKYRLQNPR